MTYICPIATSYVSISGRILSKQFWMYNFISFCYFFLNNIFTLGTLQEKQIEDN